MKIAIIGYGKMGRTIERIALERGHEIVSVIDVDNHDDIKGEAFSSADVAIEFTTPSTACANCREAINAGVAVVSGTTGWAKELEQLKNDIKDTGATLMWSSNYSLGVNLFFAINRYVTALMSRFSQYTPSMKEIHHVHKLDHPSGTAISLAEQIIEGDDKVTGWTEQASETTGGRMLIEHERLGEVPGTHIIKWDSAIDTITLEHSARSREGFALGAVMAAEWIATHKGGIFTMDDMMHSILPSKLFDIATEK